MVFNSLNFSILSQFFVVILFNKSLFLRGIIFQLQELSSNAKAYRLVVDQTKKEKKQQQQKLENRKKQKSKNDKHKKKKKKNPIISSTKLPKIFSRYGHIILYHRFVKYKIKYCEGSLYRELVYTELSGDCCFQMVRVSFCSHRWQGFLAHSFKTLAYLDHLNNFALNVLSANQEFRSYRALLHAGQTKITQHMP